MLLTLSTTHQPATDLGFLLMKHPDHILQKDLSFGKSLIFYPEASVERTTVALMVEVDPVALSRHNRPNDGAPLEPYVNDRPYASGSFLAVALCDAFSTAMSGNSKDRPELVKTPLPITVNLPCIAIRGAADLPNRWFEPLGYTVQAEQVPLDLLYPEWGQRPYLKLELSVTACISEVLKHLYVFLPALDDKKHYYMGDEEIEKLLRYGDDWLETHPEREVIVARYLKFRQLIDQVADQLSLWEEEDIQPTSTETSEQTEQRNVHNERLDRVAEILAESGATRVLDLGCGEGKLLHRLMKNAQFRQLVGLDVNSRTLELATKRLKLEERPEFAERLKLLQSSLSYPDSRLKDYDAAALVEVIEHLEPHHVEALANNLFGFARPKTIVITTPNREYNVLFEKEGQESRVMRHSDHRFEWTRAEFQDWSNAAAEKYGYDVRFEDIGEVHEEYGALTQMAIFILSGESTDN